MNRRKKKILKVYIILIPIIVFILMLIFWNINLFFKYSEVRTQNNQLFSKIEKENEKSNRTQENLFELQTEVGKEKILIKKDNLKKRGERVIKILDY